MPKETRTWALNGIFDNPDFDSKEATYSINLGNGYSGTLDLAKDGTLYRVFQYYHEEEYSNGNTTRYIEDIYVFKINPKGAVEWIRKIPNLGSLSTMLNSFCSGDNFYVLHNDHIDNANYTIGADLKRAPLDKKNMKKGCLMATVLSPDGSSKREILSSFETDGILGGVEKYHYPDTKDYKEIILMGTDAKEKKRYLGLFKPE